MQFLMAKIRMINGRLVDPFNLSPDDIDPYAFIHHLALINRFHGATIHPYSVAQHSSNLYLLVPKHLKKAAVVHDFSEAVFNDLAAPVKYECPYYYTAEQEASNYISCQLGVNNQELMELKEYDKRIYINERNALQKFDTSIGMGDERQPLDDKGMGELALFGEVGWRFAKAQLITDFEKEFPDYV